MNTQIKQYTKASIDETISYLREMYHTNEFEQWMTYFFEVIESEISESALKDSLHILEERFENRQW